jgi:hypothetical protein
VSNVFVLLAILSGPGAAAASEPCRLVADWDAQRDLVAYELRRDDCATAAPAITGSQSPRRRKSVLALYRISTGKFVDAADCEISFSLGGGESPCDLRNLRERRKTFARLRSGQRGAPADGVPDKLMLPGLETATAVDPSALGEVIVTATRTPTHRFVVLAHGRDQALLRLPDGVSAPEQRQRDLLAQAAVFADMGFLDQGRPLLKAARHAGPLTAALLTPFCAAPDVASRIESWRAASRDLDAGERGALETALVARRCFGGVMPSVYDGARSQMAVATLWLDALARHDVDRVRELSRFPLSLKGIWDWIEPPVLGACGGRIDQRDGLSESTLEVADRSAFDRAAPCLREPKILDGLGTIPALRDGRWPPNRAYWFAGTVGTTLPTSLKTLPRDVRRFAPALKTLLVDGTPVQVVLTDNDGMTDTFLMVIGREGSEWRVRAVFANERFEE